MDIDNFEWWYSEGEAPDEEWDEPLPSDVSGDDTDAVSDSDSDPAEPLTFEQAWAQAEADEAKADATATLGEPADMSISPAKTPQPRHTIDPDSTASFSILDVPAQGAQAPAPTHRPNLSREEDAGRRSPLATRSHPHRLYGRCHRLLGNRQRLEPCGTTARRCRQGRDVCRAIAQPHALGACVGRG